MTKRRSLCWDLIKRKMRPSQSLRYKPPRSKLTTPQLCMDSPTSNGQPVSNVGTNEPSSTAPIIPLPPAFSRKHGGKSLAIDAPRSSSRFFATKICAESVKRSRRLPIRCCYPKSAATAPLRLKRWQKFYPLLLHHSPTPPLLLSAKPSIQHVPEVIRF